MYGSKHIRDRVKSSFDDNLQKFLEDIGDKIEIVSVNYSTTLSHNHRDVEYSVLIIYKKKEI